MSANDPSRAHEQSYQGVVLLGRYRVLTLIGRGGMASVWLAEHMQLGSKVAVKFTRRLDPENIARFHQEAQTSAQLNSPHIVYVHDVGVHDGAPFLVMELLEGESLAELLLARGRLSPAETLQIVSQVTMALRRAHERNVIHRDLKPSNLFLVATEKNVHVKLLDFGAARIADSERTRTGDFVGTPHYMSPEQALDARQVKPSSDLWSLALIVYQCLVGRRAIQGRNLALVLQALAEHRLPVPSHHAELPPAFDAWFERATMQDPRARFPNVERFMAALEEALDEDHAASPPQDIELPLHSASSWAKRSIAVAGVLAVAGVAAGSFWWADNAADASRAEKASMEDSDSSSLNSRGREPVEDEPELQAPTVAAEAAPGAPREGLSPLAEVSRLEPKPKEQQARTPAAVPDSAPPSLGRAAETGGVSTVQAAFSEGQSPSAEPAPLSQKTAPRLEPAAGAKPQEVPLEEEHLWGPRR